MDALNDIIVRLEQQKKAIDTALAALQGVTGAAPVAPVAPAKRPYKRRAVAVKEAAPVKVKAVEKAGGISAEGRAKLAEAMKARWALKRSGSAVKKGRKK